MRYNHKLSSLILTIIAVASSFSLQSCKDQPDEFKLSDGTPTIYYIRPASYSASDSLLVEAAPQTSICLVGSNLKSIQQMFFNDKKAVLNTSYITDNTLFVQMENGGCAVLLPALTVSRTIVSAIWAAKPSWFRLSGKRAGRL